MRTKLKLIKRGTVLTFNKEKWVCDTLDILIQGDKIIDIGKDLKASENAQVIDALNKYVIPGLVDTHRHVWETAFKGIASNWTLMEYLTKFLGEIAPKMTPESVYLGNLLGALEAINSGVTTIFDWSHIMNSGEHTDAAILGLKDSGIRGLFGYGTPGTSVWDWFFESKLPHPYLAKDVKLKHFNSEDDLIQMALAIRGPEYSTLETTKIDIQMGRELNLPISMHIGGGLFGPKYCGVQKLANEKLLGTDLNFAHANTLSFHDFELLANFGCSVSITPEVEMQMGLGIPATGRVMQHGITAGLGVDIVTATSGSLFNQMRMALQAERAVRNDLCYKKGEMLDSLTISCKDVFKLATIGGAKVLGLETKIGTIEIGKQADLLLIDANSFHKYPAVDPLSSLVLYTTEQDVHTVIISGKTIKKNGALIYNDLDKLIKKSNQLSQSILKNALS